MMNLSPIAMKAVAEALEFRIAAYQHQLDTEDLSEDDISDLTNDSMFLESFLQELNKALAVPISQVF